MPKKAPPIPGHPLHHPDAVRGMPQPQSQPETAQYSDPAWQPPTDPLVKVGIQAGVIEREIPIVSTAEGWSIDLVRQALASMMAGQFDLSAQLADAMRGDSRVASAQQSRISGLLGRTIAFSAPKGLEEDPEALACLAAWEECWSTLASESALGDMQRWTVDLGMAPAQLLWDTSGPIWKPHLVPWHPRYTWWHFTERRLIAVTMDNQAPVTPGDGHWVLHAPHGSYRAWVNGAIRSVAPWWLARNYALRDWARYSERHGFPIVKAITPQGADPLDSARFESAMAGLGQESVVRLPQSTDPEVGKFDMEYLETTDQTWNTFPGLIEVSNMEITLRYLGQNLTSQVQEGSLAAARVHANTMQAILEADARGLEDTIYNQIARPFAALNFGNPDLAPKTTWDVSPPEDTTAKAQALSTFATAVGTLKTAGFNMPTQGLVSLALSMGVDLSCANLMTTKEEAVAAAKAEAKAKALLEGTKVEEEESQPLDEDAATKLAEDMTKHSITRCEHEKVNRCHLCGIERVRILIPGKDGKHSWGVQWRAIPKDDDE